MSFSTNSWDIVYSSKLDSINTVLNQAYKPKEDTITANRYKLTITNIKGTIDIGSSPENFKFTLTFDGNYVVVADPTPQTTHTFVANTAIDFQLDVNPLSATLGALTINNATGSFTTTNLKDDFFCSLRVSRVRLDVWGRGL